MLDLSTEEAVWTNGPLVIGIDEAGYGCAAGSMFVAGVCLPRKFKIPPELSRVADSKTLSAEVRAELAPLILLAAARTFVLDISVSQINEGSPFHLKYDLVDSLLEDWEPMVAIYDGNRALKNKRHDNRWIIKGDAVCFSIAAASILAKNAKDREMALAALTHPGYGFESNQGYLSPGHQSALGTLGVAPLHRVSYVKRFIGR